MINLEFGINIYTLQNREFPQYSVITDMGRDSQKELEAAYITYI